MYMMVYAVHLLANTVHQVRLLIYIIGYDVHPSGAPNVLYTIVSTVHLMANAVHPSGAPEVQHGLCSTLYGSYSTPQCCS